MKEVKINSVNFTSDNLSEFKRLYKANAHTPHAKFLFEGREFLVGYAKYLIRHLEKLFRRTK